MRHPALELSHILLARKRFLGRKKKNVIGERLSVPLPGGDKVTVYLYRPTTPPASPMPVLFSLHGGAWVFGTALGNDAQSQTLAESFGATVVNIEYTCLDEKPFPRPQEETLAVVRFFLSRAKIYNIDPDRLYLIGFSAGAHIAAGAAMLLRDAGIGLRRQILCYPFLNFVGFDYAAYMRVSGKRADYLVKGVRAFFFEKLPEDAPLLSPAAAEPEALSGLAPALLLACGDGDPLCAQAEVYADKLSSAGVPAELKIYEKARHGFLEANFPDAHGGAARNDLQRELMIEALGYIRSAAGFAPAQEGAL